MTSTMTVGPTSMWRLTPRRVFSTTITIMEPSQMSPWLGDVHIAKPVVNKQEWEWLSPTMTATGVSTFSRRTSLMTLLICTTTTGTELLATRHRWPGLASTANTSDGGAVFSTSITTAG